MIRRSVVVVLAVTGTLAACRAPTAPDPAGPEIAADELGVQSWALTTLSRSGWTAKASDTPTSSNPVNAIDTSTTTKWVTNRNQVAGMFYQVDMLAPQSFMQVRMDAGAANEFPRSFQINVSTDASTTPTNWTTIATATGTAAAVVVNFPVQVARHVQIKLLAVTPAPANIWSLAEFNVVGTMLSRSGWTAVASSTNGSNSAANALDGSTSTRWTSSSGQTGQTFQVDMKSPQTFNQLFVDAGTSTTNFPRAFKVEVSNDATVWTQVLTGTGAAAFVNITFPFQRAQFIKLSQTATNTNPWSIQELSVFGQPGTLLPRAAWVGTGSVTGGSNVAAKIAAAHIVLVQPVPPAMPPSILSLLSISQLRRR